VAGCRDRTERTLLVDIGTNGEMVLCEGGRMLACATAAGPAFEGAGLTHGCRAADGAIEHVAFGRDLDFACTVIGGGRARGLCGSAMIDFTAEALRCGLVNRMGRFDIGLLEECGRYLRTDEGHACALVDAGEALNGKPVYVTEHDVSQIMKAKAAMYAGMKTLLATEGRTFRDLERFVLAGGFAKHIDPANAICMGLLPEIPVEIIDVIGNGSLAGAYQALVNRQAMGECEHLASVPEVVELNLVKAFESAFVDALALPNLNDEEFPAVTAALAAG
jgi:uncharacterized 2Fe-2S/4Fe-4S cluster protein (DUF4445 family)